MKKLHIFSPALSAIVAMINTAAEGLGTVTLRASKRGMSVAINGKVVAKGKCPDEFHAAFKARQQNAMEAGKQ